MAANKFATMLHRNTNKITLILIYAVLEWALIFLLLLNSLFSYLILRFADYFGLQRPCPWCSRLDHLFDSRDLHLHDLVCHRHAAEISRLRFCSSHCKLAELSDLCEDCLSSPTPDKDGGDSPILEIGELDSLKCSCCGTSLERKLLCCSPLEDDSTLSCIQEENSVADQSRSDVLPGDHEVDDHQGDEEFGEFKSADSRVREAAFTEEDEKVVLIMEIKEGEGFSVIEEAKEYSTFSQTVDLQDESRKEETAQASSGCHLEFFIGGDDCELIPVEWTDSINPRSYPRFSTIMEEDQGNCGGDEDVIMDFCSPSAGKPDLGMGSFISENVAEVAASVEWSEIPERVPEEAHENSTREGDGEIAAAVAVALNGNEIEESSFSEGEKGISNDDQAAEEECGSQNDEVDAEVSIGTEIPDHEPIDVDEIHDEETISWDPCREEDQNIPQTLEYNDHDIGQNEGGTLEFRINSVETDKGASNHQLDQQCREDVDDSSTSHDFSQAADSNSHGFDIARSEEGTLELRPISIEMETDAPNLQLDDAEHKENEEEKVPDTPNSIDSLHELHRRLLLLEKRDAGSIDESLDGSVLSEIEGDEGTLTLDKLKSALRAERKALHALYTELEEERSSSAVAASQTMAMINRLQEEKAAMQMEALQYQRMMEEQSEYDQEALQLMNDLMVKRDREKEELEKELEMYRRKVEEYEAEKKNKKAMTVVLRNGKGTSDACSNEEESDGLSIDLNLEATNGEEDPMNGLGSTTPSEAVLYLEDSLTNFEEERTSILKQLKSLEEKFLSGNGEEEAEQWHCKENGNGHIKTCDSNGEVNGNGHCEMNGDKHYTRHLRFAGAKAKRLLPLFDATREEEMNDDWSQRTPVDHLELEDDKVAFIEEVDHIYERLQVLEADREFLKHCIGSLRKGDKGLELLGEILQHLRDLRCAELHGQDIIIGDGIMQY